MLTFSETLHAILHIPTDLDIIKRAARFVAFPELQELRPDDDEARIMYALTTILEKLPVAEIFGILTRTISVFAATTAIEGKEGEVCAALTQLLRKSLIRSFSYKMQETVKTIADAKAWAKERGISEEEFTLFEKFMEKRDE